MIRDAIIDEVRAVRDEMAKECGYDVHELFKAFRRMEAVGATRHASFVSRSAESAAVLQRVVAGGIAHGR